MANEIDARLQKLGITLPAPAAPAANYVPTVQTGKLLFVSGQIPSTAAGPQFVGKVGREISVEQGREAARIRAINLLGAIKAAVGGDLSKVVRVVKVVGFVNSVPDFTEPHKVVNGASDLITEVLGDKVGKHARSAVGMGTLPLGVCVEVEAIVEVA